MNRALDFEIRFNPFQTSKTHLVLHAAVLANDLKSQVNSGENSGQALAHEFVVVAQHSQPFATKNGVLVDLVHLEVPDSPPTSKHSVAFWITEDNGPTDNLNVVQATGGDLPF